MKHEDDLLSYYPYYRFYIHFLQPSLFIKVFF